MKAKNFVFACFSTFLLLSMLGCASLGGNQFSGTNWALTESGGEITAFSENRGHPASTLNNGITSSEDWHQGEGWEAPMGGSGRAGGRGGGSGGRQGRSGDGRGEGNWVIVTLPQPVIVTHLRLYTIDSEQYPAKDFGVSHLLIQYESETTLGEKVWISADRYGKGVGARDNIVRDNANGIIDVRFKAVKTRRIRVIIYGTNDMARSDDNAGGRGGQGGRGGREGNIRLTEIEVYGT